MLNVLDKLTNISVRQTVTKIVNRFLYFGTSVQSINELEEVRGENVSV